MEKLIILVNIHYLLFFLRDIHEGYLSLENAYLKQSNFAIELKNFGNSRKTLEKKTFFKKQDYYLVQEKKFLIDLKADYFQ